jgi:hypothetical protein
MPKKYQHIQVNDTKVISVQQFIGTFGIRRKTKFNSTGSDIWSFFASLGNE